MKFTARFLVLFVFLLAMAACTVAEDKCLDGTPAAEDLQLESGTSCTGNCTGICGEPGIVRFFFCQFDEFADYRNYLCACCIKLDYNPYD